MLLLVGARRAGRACLKIIVFEPAVCLSHLRHVNKQMLYSQACSGADVFLSRLSDSLTWMSQRTSQSQHLATASRSLRARLLIISCSTHAISAVQKLGLQPFSAALVALIAQGKGHKEAKCAEREAAMY